MNRRQLLRATAAGAAVTALSGCLGTVPGIGDSSPGSSATEYTATVDVEASERQVGFAEEVDDPPLAFDAAVVEGGYTDDVAPLTVELTVTNVGDEPVTYIRDPLLLFRTSATDDDHWLFRLFPELVDELQFTGACWRREFDSGVPLIADSDDLEPGEDITRTSVLVLDADEPCPMGAPDDIVFTATARAEPIPVGAAVSHSVELRLASR